MATNSFPPLPQELSTNIPAAEAQQNTVNDGLSPITGPIPSPLPGTFPKPIPGPFPGGWNPPTIPGLDPGLFTRWTSWRLKKGTWLFNWTRTPNFAWLPDRGILDGTFRFDNADLLLGIRGSGDIYRRPATWIPPRRIGDIVIPGFWLTGPAPPKDQGIPIFSRAQYEGYFRVTSISLFMTGNSFTMEFEKYKWDAAANNFTTNATGVAVVEATYTVTLTFTTGATGWPSNSDYLTGDVKLKSTGVTVAQMQMGWVSDKYRKIGLELDAVQGCSFPLLNTSNQSIWSLLEAAGLQLSKQVADESNIADTPNSLWRNAELNAAMLAHRQTVDLDKEWTYHGLMVPQFLDQPGVIGIMYDDITVADSNNVAREGFALAAHLPTTSSSWGTEANGKLQDAHDSYVRSTIHELSHAMGLHHPPVYDPPEEEDDSYTCQTGSIQRHANEKSLVYPSNVQWRYSPAALKRLRHYPDIRVRPGGIQFSKEGGANGAAPWVPPNDVAPPIPGLKLELAPVLRELPIGAPVRVELTLHNESEFPAEVPKDISLTGSAMKGDVQDPSGLRRPYRPVTICADSTNHLTLLEAGETMKTSMTLLAGRQGPLFPSTGVHTITAILNWTQHDSNGSPMTFWLDAKTTVMVTGARSASHAAAAHRVLAEPQTLLTLVFAGDHLESGLKAVQQACEDETLGPHWACIEARRCANRFMDRKADVERARKLIGRKGVVMSEAEKEKMDRLCKGA